MILPKFLKKSKILKIGVFFLIGAGIGTLILALLLALAVLRVKKEYEVRVYPGVFWGQISLAGKTEEELVLFLNEKQAEIDKRRVVFFWNNNGTAKWEVTASQIDFSLNRQEMVKEIFSLGREGKGMASFAKLYHLFLFSQVVTPKFSFDESKLDGFLAAVGSQVERPVKDALFDFRAGRVINFQPSQAGWRLEKERIQNLLILAFSQINSSKETVNLDLPVTKIWPRVTTEQTNNLGIETLLGEGESFFFDSIPSRVHNIALAVSRLHGIVVPPGETFSFAEQIGTISTETGYQQAYVIKDKKTVLEDGGGVCQVSTTLFRAALAAGLPIIERQPHYYRVGFYEQGGYPPGLDATVYPPSPDFKFKNDTPAYLLIQASLDKQTKRLAFILYGTSDGRRTEVEKPKIYSQTPPPEPVYIDDPTLPTGMIKQTDKPHWGAKVSFKRKVWWANGELKEEREFWSNYTALPAFYLRGVGQ